MTTAFALFLLLVAADLTGTWDFQVQTDAGAGSPTFVLKQTGDKITGTYSGALGEAQVRGTVKDQEVTLEFDTDATGEKATVRYSGRLDGESKMKGKVSLGPYEGTFTATKKAAAR